MNNLPSVSSVPAIAIIGLSCRFPGAKNATEFWKNLCEGVESISFYTDETLLAAGVDPSLLKKANYVKAKGELADVDLMDAAFFDLTPKEGMLMDPQHRLSLECAWEALEDAGYYPERYDGVIGVYGGVSLNTYLLFNLASNPEVIEPANYLQATANNRNDHVTTRIAYKLNLKGPAVTVQTACSTSLVATHLACLSLINRECDMALAFGSSVTLPARAGYLYQEGGILSPDGHCRAFDMQGQGTIVGNGVGVVILKRLEDAVADRDHIYAVIKGSAINNDGSVKVGYTAPSAEGQARVIVEAQAIAGVAPETIGYIEAHGTGTPLGDPIEIAALSKAFRLSTEKKGYCAIGSVKTNIGHTDAAAGVAGLIKAALAVNYGLIPPSLHFFKPNPQIDFNSSPFYVNTTLAEWGGHAGPRRAAVSSFGIGGTNAHVILEQPPVPESSNQGESWEMLALSARSSKALEEATLRLAEHLGKSSDQRLRDVAYTLLAGRKEFPYRRIVVCSDAADAADKLSNLQPRRAYTNVEEPRKRKIVFMYPGQGTQYVNMGRGLYEEVECYREELDKCSAILKEEMGEDIRSLIYPDKEREEEARVRLRETEITQAAIYAVEYALSRMWMNLGVQPDSMIGHSIGEYVAATIAGVIDVKEALRLVAARGRLMSKAAPGGMLAVWMGEDEARTIMGERLSLAATNGPGMSVVSGPTGELEKLESALKLRGKTCKRLETSHGFHSWMMGGVAEEYIEEVKNVRLKAPEIKYISNVSGGWIGEKDVTDPKYWADHIRYPVRFAEGILHFVSDPDYLLLEVGPGRSLMSIARWHPLKAPGQMALTTLRQEREPDSDLAFLLMTLGKMWASGVDGDWLKVHSGKKARRVSLPTYPFERRRFWVNPKETNKAAGEESLRKNPEVAKWFYIPSWKRSMPRLLSGGARLKNISGSWLVFADDAGVSDHLARRLSDYKMDVVSVLTGAGFSKPDGKTYVINPRRRQDYDDLFDDLRRSGRMPSRIVHLWTITPAEYPQHSGDEILSRGFHSLIFLTQALTAVNNSDPVRIDVIADGALDVTGEEAITAEKAAVIGPCKVIPQEYSYLTCCYIDIDLLNPDRVTSLLLSEFERETVDPVVAYRRGHRWVRTYESVTLDGRDFGGRLKENGVYLITGGVGGIGLAISEYLSKSFRAKLALTGRSDFPEREGWDQWVATHDDGDKISQRLKKLSEIDGSGNNVLILNADVCNLSQMEGVVRTTVERFGSINGVIHAAGVSGGGVIALKSSESAAHVLDPKIKGARVLETVLRGIDLDFFALCSSRTAILGGYGQVDYCSANIFLDSFAAYYSKKHNTYSVSINWDAWQEVGMLAETARQVSSLKRASAPVSQGGSHPLLGECVVKSQEEIIYDTWLSVKNQWILDDHRIVGTAVVPGVAYLEMARAALGQGSNGQIVELQDIVFLAPLGMRDDEEKQVRIKLHKTEDMYEFLVSSNASANASSPKWVDHAMGKITYAAPEPAIKYNIASLKKRCNLRHIVFDAEYDQNNAEYDRDADFGPRWQCLKQVYVGNGEALIELELAEEFSGDLDQYLLHPALLDRANATAKDTLGPEGAYLPISYRRLRLRSPLLKSIYAHSRFKDEGNNKETISFDVVLMDRGGSELLKIDSFSQKRVNDTTAVIKTLAKGLSQQSDHARLAPDHDKEQQDIYQSALSEGILPNEGAEALGVILAAGNLPQIIVSTKDLNASITMANKVNHSAVMREAKKVQTVVQAHPRPNLKTDYVAPKSDLERTITEIWQEVLGISQIGVHDNLFELGGDSVGAIQILAKLNDLGIELTPEQLFQYQTIAELEPIISSTTARGRGE